MAKSKKYQVEYKRYLVVDKSKIDITDCVWCGNRNDAVCGACTAKADELRNFLAKQS